MCAVATHISKTSMSQLLELKVGDSSVPLRLSSSAAARSSCTPGAARRRSSNLSRRYLSSINVTAWGYVIHGLLRFDEDDEDDDDEREELWGRIFF